MGYKWLHLTTGLKWALKCVFRGAWLAQSVKHASLGPWGHEFEPHTGHRDYIFLKKCFKLVSIFGCLSGMPVLLLVFISYLDLEKYWIQSISVFIWPTWHIWFFRIYFVLMFRCNFLKFEEGHDFRYRKPIHPYALFSLFLLFSPISIIFEYFVRCHSQLTQMRCVPVACIWGSLLKTKSVYSLPIPKS